MNARRCLLAFLFALQLSAPAALASSRLAVRPFALGAAYFDRAGSSGVCTAGAKRNIVGFEPSATGRYPLFIYLTGTTMRFDAGEARKISEEMAKRGFVAASVEYDNRAYAYCNGMRAKAHCIFGKAGTASALDALCAKPNAACDAGIVVAGFSQGANLAAMSADEEPRVKGAYLLGHGNRPSSFMDVTACQRAESTALEATQTRSISGEHDGFFGKTSAGVRRQLEIVSGKQCQDAFDCTQPDGSGWAIVRDAQLKDGSADHCYFFQAADGYCAKYDGFDPAWLSGSEPWALGPSLDWLAARIPR